MQKRGCGIRTGIEYRERLSPSLWALVAAAVCGPMAALVFSPIDTTVALVVGLLVSVGIVSALVALSPVVEVRDGELRAGRAHIPVEYLGVPAGVVADEARTARGSGLDRRAWHLIRGGIDGIVTVPVTDPDDPTPLWVVSTRTPDRLVAAIQRAQVRLRTPGR
ncbi:MAG: DUF3093 domain-containing protein [Microbacterium sp.]|uniref:DUF3093 domain-containing protein n=1 Tax=unclassified Microbacterium TaxID=2609290 RepID=UPI0024B747CF|nr:MULTISPECIES: DUF3093 domain-containing protein [unclassified Microbacterium]MBQ9917103.1 DUF3093 domain-containing protein [Microbacterium sp.]MDI9890414.1 DUF3093 domain-containing protein [Microbacterium sp. IEGM 1404]